jgi:amino acid permease
MFGISILILIPLCLLKDISKMRFASLAGICIILYSIIVVTIEFPFFFYDYLTTDDPQKSEKINFFDISSGFTDQLLFFKGAGTIFFAYTCHVGAFPVYKTLKNNGLRRIEKVFRRSIILDTVLYVLIGVCGYLSVPYDVPALIINRTSIFKNDAFMIIGRLGIAITLMLTLPANYNAFRLSFSEQVFGSTEITDKNNLIITIPTILIATMIAVLYDKISDYISILGGFCSVIIAFIFPGIM